MAAGRRRARRPRRPGTAAWRVVGALLGTLTVVIALLIAGFIAVGVAGAQTAPAMTAPAIPACPAANPVTIGSIVVPSGPVAGFCQDQLENAAQIMNAARSLGIGTHTQTVGVMTAIGESHLRNLDYGDSAGPDSRGLFQQRDNGAWGTLADRMDPYTSALHFFQKAIRVPGWQTMAPSELAHAVQGNADPDYYAQYWVEAQEVVTALSQ